jgi:hypothetical protein
LVICPGGWTFRLVVQAACSEDIDIGRQALEERAAHLWIEGDLVACRPTDVPGVDQYVTTQQGHDLSGIDLGRWIVADRRDVDDAVEEPRALEYSFERLRRRHPATDGVVLRALRLGAERSEEQDVVEADHMLEDTPGVPSAAR